MRCVLLEYFGTKSPWKTKVYNGRIASHGQAIRSRLAKPSGRFLVDSRRAASRRTSGKGKLKVHL